MIHHMAISYYLQEQCGYPWEFVPLAIRPLSIPPYALLQLGAPQGYPWLDLRWERWNRVRMAAEDEFRENVG